MPLWALLIILVIIWKSGDYVAKFFHHLPWIVSRGFWYTTPPRGSPIWLIQFIFTKHFGCRRLGWFAHRKLHMKMRLRMLQNNFYQKSVEADK